MFSDTAVKEITSAVEDLWTSPVTKCDRRSALEDIYALRLKCDSAKATLIGNGKSFYIYRFGQYGDLVFSMSQQNQRLLGSTRYLRESPVWLITAGSA